MDWCIIHSFSISANCGACETSITTFHECYGSPLLPPTHAVRRAGNVRWTGVPCVHYSIWHNQSPSRRTSGRKVWTLVFLPAFKRTGIRKTSLEDAMAMEVLLAYEINGRPLDRERGGPVRLVVLGWFGTIPTKWVCRILLQDRRAPGPFTTIFYNDLDPTALMAGANGRYGRWSLIRLLSAPVLVRYYLVMDPSSLGSST
ncbi:Oxidoreductase, molybdopterin-binding domain-containing protein [Aspergillus falconensis]